MIHSDSDSPRAIPTALPITYQMPDSKWFACFAISIPWQSGNPILATTLWISSSSHQDGHKQTSSGFNGPPFNRSLDMHRLMSPERRHSASFQLRRDISWWIWFYSWPDLFVASPDERLMASIWDNRVDCQTLKLPRQKDHFKIVHSSQKTM